MSLRDIANADLQEIMNADETGGVECTITAPDGSTDVFKAFHNDIHLAIDPDTGEVVTGRQSTVAVLANELTEAGFEEIGGVSDASSRPWLVTIDDVEGNTSTHKVFESYPDAAIGLVVLRLEFYEQ